MRNTIVGLICCALALIALGGCGGSGHDGPSVGKGSLALRVRWPAQDATSRLIPEAANSIVATVTENGQTVATTQPPIVRPQTTYQIDNIPAGSITISASAYASTDGTGTPLATGSVSGVEVTDGAVAQAPALAMNSTVASVVVSVGAGSVQSGSTLTATATAKDSAGDSVLVAPSAWTWSSSNTAVATVTGSGTNSTAAVTGATTGTADITASYTEPSPAVSGKATVSVSTSGGTAGQKKTNPGDGAEMIWIPGGTFTMGSTDFTDAPPNQQTVAGFWMYTKDVTNAEYAKFMQATGHAAPEYWTNQNYNGAQQPVVGVTWFDAVAYAKWAGVRLPTEAEWEYAARGGRQLKYGTSTGDLSPDLANYWSSDPDGKSGADQWEYTSPVGSFPPNPFGLYDMCGNMWQWCSSIYTSYPYSATDGRENMSDTTSARVLRGGSWGSNYSSGDDLRCAYRGDDLRCAYRGDDSPGFDSFLLYGFRCAQGP